MPRSREPSKVPHLPVTVAVDGSEYADAAAFWAAGEAVRREAVLRLLAVVKPRTTLGVESGIGPDSERLEGALGLLAQTQSGVRAAHPELEMKQDVLVGDPVHELEGAALEAAVLVLGSRGRGGAGPALGSVSLHLAGSAPGSIVIVPQGHAAATHPGPTVVGIDSHECTDVLRFALEHVNRAGGGLRVVHVWTPYPTHSSAEYASATDIAARHAAERAVAWLKVAHVGEFDVRPEITTLRGRPGEVMAEQSLTADLIVLGSHRRRVPLSGAVGPVLRYALDRSHCPVAVVPLH